MYKFRLLFYLLIPHFVCLLAFEQRESCMNATGGAIESGKFTLRYQSEGTGIPALVLGSSIYYSRIFSQNLRKHMRLHFIDNRAWAKSQASIEQSEYEFDLILDDIELMRKALGLGKVIIIGHSGHAFMALEYAKKYPESVSHVVMIGTGPDFSAESFAAAQQYWNDFALPERKAVFEQNYLMITDEQLAQLSPDQRWIKNYIRIGPKVWYDWHFDSSPLWQGVYINMPVFEYIWGTVFKGIDITQGLDSFDKPVFLGLGRYDFIMPPPSSWNQIYPLFKDLTLQIFEHSGHTPQYEEPQLFDEQLLEWITSKKN